MFSYSVETWYSQGLISHDVVFKLFDSVLVLVQGRTLNCEQICNLLESNQCSPPETVWCESSALQPKLSVGIYWESWNFSVAAAGMAWEPGFACRAEAALWHKKACGGWFCSMKRFNRTSFGLFCITSEKTSLNGAHLIYSAQALMLKRMVALNNVPEFTLEEKVHSLSLATHDCWMWPPLYRSICSLCELQNTYSSETMQWNYFHCRKFPAASEVRGCSRS